MSGLVEISDDEEYDVPVIIPKSEGLDYDSRTGMDNVASSSGTSLRSSFIAMGFPQSHVDKAIRENGEGNTDILLETLSAYSELHQPKTEPFDDGIFSNSGDVSAANLHMTEVLHKSESLDSLERLFMEDTINSASGEAGFLLKEEPDVAGGVSDEKMASLLKMNFSLEEVRFALDRLGKDASIDQLMDFIFAGRMAKKYEKNANYLISGDKESNNQDCNNEALFGIMEKTLRLLEIGFSENEISTAFENCGSEVPLQELAESIFTAQTGGTGSIIDKHSSNSSNSSVQVNGQSLYRTESSSSSSRPFDPFIVKTEEINSENGPQSGIAELLEKIKGKRPKVEYSDEPLPLRNRKKVFHEDLCNKKKVEPRKGNSSSTSNWVSPSQSSAGFIEKFEEDIKPEISMPTPRRCLSNAAAKPPHFLYGNVTKLSHDSWIKISQFLFTIQPEYVNTQFYSALSRKEGYVHNLPTENRSNIWPKGPMTIQEALPHTKKWWPSWDTRKHLSYINCETSGISYHCDRFGRMLAESKGRLSSEKQEDLLGQCETSSLIWTGSYKLGPFEPEHLEHIMGYPVHHTRIPGFSSSERLMLLKLSFQTDTLGYHLSVLRRRPTSPKGFALLSFFTGIGGAEVALHRLGIRLNVVISVEPCEKKRKILKHWWDNSAQTGELIQIDNIHNVSGNKVEELTKKYGGFDLVVCQNPYAGADIDSLSGVDFSLFAEFFRVLQRVRNTMEISR